MRRRARRQRGRVDQAAGRERRHRRRHQSGEHWADKPHRRAVEVHLERGQHPRQLEPGRSELPGRPLELFGPGTDSGTFDYFTDAVNGEEGVSRTDYQATEDDNVAVQGVAGSKGGMAYFGLSYYEQNADQLKVVAIDDGNGPVTPSRETVQSGEYTPLSRPLFVYPAV